MRVAFRVDASSEIGLGHFKRCMSLAKALRDIGSESCFVMRDLGFDPAAELAANNYPLYRLPVPASTRAHVTSHGTAANTTPHATWAGIDQSIDAEETALALASTPLDWLVVDQYAFDARWHRLVRARLACSVAVIDDVADRMICAQVLIDHNHCADHREKYGGHLPLDVPILGGPAYALLGPGYADAPRYAFNEDVRSIGIFMGGADAGGFSTEAWRACREVARFPGLIEIVTTSSNPHLQELNSVCAIDLRCTLTIDAPSLESFYARHDIQVGAGGGATWERCCIGAPTVATAVASNQLSVLEPLRELGVLRISSRETSELGRQIGDLIQNPELRRSLSKSSRLLVDGLGSKRVTNYLLESC